MLELIISESPLIRTDTVVAVFLELHTDHYLQPPTTVLPTSHYRSSAPYICFSTLLYLREPGHEGINFTDELLS